MSLIVVLGAGRSAGYFIDYTIEFTKQKGYRLKIVDLQTKHLKEKQTVNPHLDLEDAELSNDEVRRRCIKGSSWVVSMLPAFMHIKVASDCLEEGCNLATASYVSEEMKSLSDKAASKGLIFLNECGLDPGIDHMSAVKIIHEIQSKGGKVTSFKSYCGGLVAPECNDNPWGYKFSWNPRNVVLAGQGTASYLFRDKLQYVPYHRIFQDPEVIFMPDGTVYEGYANRDSLTYINVYGLEGVSTLLRGTLRYPGYCRAWNLLVHLGFTDDTYKYQLNEGTTYHDFFQSYLNDDENRDVYEKIRTTIGMSDYEDDAIERVLWTGLNSDEVIPLKVGTPAMILQDLLEQKWKLQPNDRDMIVMQHLFIYERDGKSFEVKSSMIIEGENEAKTAMSKTVGLPLAIALKTIIDTNFKERGVIIPTMPSLYVPILNELEKYGIRFQEEETVLT
jgi:saccharopine dehydrogenase-like NADP-dependent oxidoreductase